MFFFITPKRIKLRNGIVSSKYYHITFCALRKKPMGVEETKRLINCRKYTAVLLFYSKKVRKKCDLPGQYLLLIHKTKNPTIFNMLRWVTGQAWIFLLRNCTIPNHNPEMRLLFQIFRLIFIIILVTKSHDK